MSRNSLTDIQVTNERQAKFPLDIGRLVPIEELTKTFKTLRKDPGMALSKAAFSMDGYGGLWLAHSEPTTVQVIGKDGAKDVQAEEFTFSPLHKAYLIASVGCGGPIYAVAVVPSLFVKGDTSLDQAQSLIATEQCDKEPSGQAATLVDVIFQNKEAIQALENIALKKSKVK